MVAAAVDRKVGMMDALKDLSTAASMGLMWGGTRATSWAAAMDKLMAWLMGEWTVAKKENN